MAEVLKTVAAPPLLKLAEWADTYRFLSSEASASPGKFITAAAPYQREIMDTITEPAVEEVVLIMASQTGKTEIFNNAVGYYIHQDPSPIMMVQPTKEMAEAWSKDRLMPMIRDSPCLSSIININSKRDGENTILHKKFYGGNITIAGANSPASLASRPKRIMILDEVDRYPLSAKKEGRPSKLAIKRTTTFWNRKILKSSSPTIRGQSEIETDYLNSDQRKYWIECPHCKTKQKMVWEQLRWPKDQPENAYYACVNNGCIIGDGDKYYMIFNGEWRAEAPFKGKAGFHLSSLYSPWVKFAELATKFVEAAKDPEKLKVFINTDLAESYEENLEGEGIEEDELLNRVADYTNAPAGVVVITMAVDVQDDRLEYEILGWGLDEESWSIKYDIIHGDPGTFEVWRDLENIIESSIPHEYGFSLPISSICIDAGGHHAESVYLFCKNKQKSGRRVYPIRGYSQSWRPVISKSSRNNSHKVKMFFIGTDTAKDIIFSRLKIEERGAGYCHFPAHYQDSYFKGLTSEKLVLSYKKGRSIKQYIKKKASIRNEPLDLRVYNLAAFKILNPVLPALRLRIEEKRIKTSLPQSNTLSKNKETPETKKIVTSSRRKSGKGFVGRWKSDG